MIEMSPLAFAVALAGLSMSGYFVLQTWRRRSEPTAPALFGTAVALCAGLAVHLATVHLAPSRTALTAVAGPWVLDSWIGFAFLFSVTTLGFWGVFAFEYAGAGDRVRRAIVAFALSAPLLLLAGIGGSIATGLRGVELLNVLLVAAAILAATIAIVGTFFLLETVIDLRGFPTGGAVLLSAGAVLVVPAPFLAGGFEMPLAYSLSGLASSVAFVAAIARYRIFETLPLTRVVGRDRVIDEMDDGIVVVDRDGTIRDLNRAAIGMFDLDRTASVGEGIEDVLPTAIEPNALADRRTPVRVHAAGRAFAVTASEIRDVWDRRLGALVVVRDETDRHERERRLAVVNRFLRETVREEIRTVERDAGRLDAAARDDDGDRSESPHDRSANPEAPAVVADRIWRTATGLGTLVSAARTIEQCLSESAGTVEDVREVLVGVATAHESADVTQSPDDPVTAAIGATTLETLVELLVEVAFDDESSIELSVPADGGNPGVQLSGRLAFPAESNRDGERPVSELAVGLVRTTVESGGGSLELHRSASADDRIAIALPAADPTVTTSDSGRRLEDHEVAGDGDGRSTAVTERGDPTW